MKKFLKKFIKMLSFFVIIGLVAFAVVWVQGYQIYQEKTESTSVEIKVEEIRQINTFVALKNTDSDFLRAVVATEDRRFYKHNGFDIRGTARAITVNIMNFQALQGGSTITQQLAKNFYFGETENLKEKVAEIYIALELEKKYTKEEILELYINTIYYGDNHYGIYEASWGYFQKVPSDLNLYEATLLAGLPQAPSAYALSNGKDLAHKRQEAVVQAMVNEHYITDTQKQEVLAQAAP